MDSNPPRGLEEAGSKLSLPKVRLNGIQDNANLSMFIKFCIAGSHLVLKHCDGRMVVLPMHSKDIPTGTLYAIVIHQAKLSLEEWKNL